MNSRKHLGRTNHRTLNLETLETRLNPSWTIPPKLIAIPAATDIALNSQQTVNTTASITKTEIDYYSFTPTWSATYKFQASRNASSIDTVMALYTSSGSRVAYNDDISSSNSDSLISTNLVAGQKYFIGVTNYTGEANGNYSLDVTGLLTDDTRENNDTLATSYNLGTVSTATNFTKLVMADSADYFKFTTTTATTGGLIKIDFKNTQGNLDLSLLDSTGKVLQSSLSTTADSESVNLGSLPAGTYTILVAGKGGAYNPDYTLTLNPGAGSTPPSPPPASTKNDWTIAVYMTATDLATFAAEDVNEMEIALASLPKTVKITLLYDQWSSQKIATGGGTQAAWGDTGRAVLSADTNASSIKTTFEKLGEKNTGDPAVLTDFLSWTVTAAPANHYALLLWNHGSGLDGSNYDDESNDHLKISEIVAGVKNSGISLDLISFDACLMGMVENAYSLKDTAKVIAASQELEEGTGNDYTTVFNTLKVNPNLVDALSLGKGMVDSYAKQYVGTGTFCDTYSVIDTRALTPLAASLAAFSSTITTADIANFRNIVGKTTTYGDGEFDAYHDLGQVMRAMSANTNGALKAASDAVIKALDAAVFARTPDSRGSFGLSIYIPLLASEKDAAFADHSGYALATGWASLLGKLGI